MNSFELDTVVIDNRVIIDRDYYNIKEEQFKQVFSEMVRRLQCLTTSFCYYINCCLQDFLGWYSTGENPTENDIDVHKQICEINESPLFLQLNPNSNRPSNLPVAVFESVIDIVGGEARMLFVKLGYTLATEEVMILSSYCRRI